MRSLGQQHISIITVSQLRGGKLLSITISVFGTLQRSDTTTKIFGTLVRHTETSEECADFYKLVSLSAMIPHTIHIFKTIFAIRMLLNSKL